jgi:hypothetical protein
MAFKHLSLMIIHSQNYCNDQEKMVVNGFQTFIFNDNSQQTPAQSAGLL